jgi:putative nucleotidyltransferase with HDIG domain
VEHLLAVARLAQIYNLEEGCGVEKELVYAAAILHDIGRGEQYLHGIPHDQAGAELAGPILTDCGFTSDEILRICAAIAAHRRPESDNADFLARLLHRADKNCRPCYFCSAAEECNWPEEQLNKTVE